MKIVITVRSKKGEDRNLDFLNPEQLVIGRSAKNDVVLDDHQISRKHLSLSGFGEEGFLCKPLSQMGELYVDGLLVEESEKEIAYGSLLEFGPYTLSFHMESDEKPESAEAPEGTALLEDPNEELVEEELIHPQDEAKNPAEQGEGEFAEGGDFDFDQLGSEQNEAEAFAENNEGDYKGSDDEGPDDFAASPNLASDSTEVTDFLGNMEFVFVGLENFPFDEFHLSSNKVVIGRSKKADIPIEDVEASRKHAEILRDGIKCSIRDLNSSNGVHVNDQKVNECELSPGDEIRVSHVRFRFEIRNTEQMEQAALVAASSQFSVGDQAVGQLGDQAVALSDQGVAVGAYTGGADQGSSEAYADASAFNEAASASNGNKSLLQKFRELPPKRQVLWMIIILGGLWFLLDDSGTQKTAEKSNVNQTQKSAQNSSAGAQKKGGNAFELLTKEEQRRVDAAYEKAFKHYQAGEYSQALLELQNGVFSFVSDYKNSRQLQALSRRGVSQLAEVNRERIRKKEEAERQKELQELLAEVKSLVKADEYEEAKEYFPRIFELDPENAYIAELREKRQKELEEKRRLQAQREKRAKERKERKEILQKGKELIEKEQYIKGIVILKNFSERGNAFEHREAGRIAEETKESLKDRILPLMKEAEGLAESGDTKAAIKKYEEVLAITPKNRLAKSKIDDLYDQIEGEARKIYTEAVITRSLGKVDEAKEMFEKVIERTPAGSKYHENAKKNLKGLK
jgi:pSer/pThr/pTyr-binding forkhead associated (FHA) protein